MQIFLVGGAVRDELLGFPFNEKDWVVVGSNTTTMLSKGFTSVGKDFPVFLHPKTKDEYALARLERKSGPGYKGFDIVAEENVTLEQDLERRDLTINAIAKDEKGHYFDPYGGINDLNQRVLRHVSNAFCEDPVRILRIARFAARYHFLGFKIAEETMTLMKAMVRDGEVDHLVAERVWQEFSKALKEKDPHIFIEALKKCGALKVILPELDQLFGVPQPEKHHPEIDCGIHSLMCLQQATDLSNKQEVRFATLMHDLGKGLTPKEQWPQHINHEKRGLKSLKNVCIRLSVPNSFRDLAILVMEFHTHCHRAFELNEKTLLKVLERLDVFRKQERFKAFLTCCKADARGRTTFEKRQYLQANYLFGAFLVCKNINIKKLVAAGFKGSELGIEIHRQRLRQLKEYKKSCSTTKQLAQTLTQVSF